LPGDQFGRAADIVPNGLPIFGASEKIERSLTDLRRDQREFDKYGDVVGSLARQLNTVTNSVENLGKRTRAMSRKLKTVEALPNQQAAEKLLGFSANDIMDGAPKRPVTQRQFGLPQPDLRRILGIRSRMTPRLFDLNRRAHDCPGSRTLKYGENRLLLAANIFVKRKP
jgi:hypothetical protein